MNLQEKGIILSFIYGGFSPWLPHHFRTCGKETLHLEVGTAECSSWHSSQEVKRERAQYLIDLLVPLFKVEPTFTILAFGGYKNVKETTLNRPLR